MFIALLVLNWKQIKCPSRNERSHTMDYYSAIKKMHATTLSK